MYEAVTIKMKESGVFSQMGSVFGYAKGQIIHVADKQEYAHGEMMPRTAAIMLMMKRAEVSHA